MTYFQSDISPYLPAILLVFGSEGLAQEFLRGIEHRHYYDCRYFPSCIAAKVAVKFVLHRAYYCQDNFAICPKSLIFDGCFKFFYYG